MLLVFSEHCNDSEYIRREVTVAGESHKPIIPFRIENAQPRRGLRVRLSDLHWIDGFVSRERAIDQVMRAVDRDGSLRQTWQRRHQEQQEAAGQEAEARRQAEEAERRAAAERQVAERRRREEEQHRAEEEEARRRAKEARGAAAAREAEAQHQVEAAERRAAAERQPAEGFLGSPPSLRNLRPRHILALILIGMAGGVAVATVRAVAKLLGAP
jgi:flagellar biosynthesis GTPase FlhF